MENQGILLVNKPIGYSTFDIIRDFKRHTSFKGKIGHAGTLDVFANGLVILLINTTKQFSSFQELKKHYLASVRLGVSSTTLDIEGELNKQQDSQKPSKEEIQNILCHFIGTYEQTIPSYSAAKFEGKPLYKHAREGNMIIHKSKSTTIETLDLLAYKYPLATLRISCSSGTYIRQLTYDLFKEISQESLLFSLTRTQIGEYLLKDAISLEDFLTDSWKNHLITLQ